MSVNVPEIFRQMPNYFIKGGLDKSMSIYFSIGNNKYTVLLDPESCKVEVGKTVASADLVLKTTPELFDKLVNKGWTPGTMDFMRGRVKSNDPMGLMVLRQVFKFPGS